MTLGSSHNNDPPERKGPDAFGAPGTRTSGGNGPDLLAPEDGERKGGTTLEGALAWVAAGFPIFPCHNQPGSDRHKAPLTHKGFKDATTDPDQINAWLECHPNALIGMPTGTASGIAVLDLDKKNGKDGFAAVHDWRNLSPVVVMTGGGGAHIYFRADSPIRCSTGKDGVDVRGDGGYVIVPPSEGYSWLNGSDLTALPNFPQLFRPADHVALPNVEPEAEPAMVAAALEVIPNDDEDYDSWVRTGLAIYAATGGSDEGLEAWDKWSQKSTKYDGHTTARRWEKFDRSPPNSIGAGTIFFEADLADPDWRTRYHSQVEADAQRALAEGANAFAAELGLKTTANGVKGDERAFAGAALPSAQEKPPATILAAPARPIGLGIWNAGKDDHVPQPRQWLLGNVYCRRYVSSLIADGGCGKSSLRILQAISLATGKSLTGEYVFQRCRVLLMSLEDDPEELRRRVRAAMLHHGIRPEELDGWLFLLADPPGKFVTVDPRTKRPIVSALKAQVDKVIIEHKIDVLIIDPLVKSHDVEENDNTGMDVVVQTFSRMAIEHNIAVDLLHHTSKGAADPGNADRGRGASAVKNGARLVYTLSAMSVDEAGRFGIDEGQRRSYVRVDSGKVNITPPLERAQWFQLVSVPLGNATDLYPNGDNVQTMVPWTPPQIWAGVTDDILKRILDEIDHGPPEGGRYSNAPKATTRAAWPVVARHAPGKTEKQCRQFISELVKQKRLIVKDYRDATTDGKTRTGLFLFTQEDADNVPM